MSGTIEIIGGNLNKKIKLTNNPITLPLLILSVRYPEKKLAKKKNGAIICKYDW